MSSGLYTIKILGTSVTVRTEEDLGYIKHLETMLQETISEVRAELGLGDSLSLAIMAGIFLADANNKLEDRLSFLKEIDRLDTDKALIQINGLLDRTLKE
jgi:cell division protein ZapA (FtsZ GTPase activity inhibitor)